MADLLQMKGDTEDEFKLVDPIIHDRELAFAIDYSGQFPAKMKLGVGKKWSETPYFAGLNGTNGRDGVDGKDGAKGEQGEAGKDGESADHEAVVALQESVRLLKTQPWTILSVLPMPLPADIEFGLPLTRAGVMTSIDFRVYGVYGAPTVITVKQNSKSIETITINKLGLTTLTFPTAIKGVLDDTFSYSVNVDGLKGAIVVCNQKWVNK